MPKKFQGISISASIKDSLNVEGKVEEIKKGGWEIRERGDALQESPLGLKLQFPEWEIRKRVGNQERGARL